MYTSDMPAPLRSGDAHAECLARLGLAQAARRHLVRAMQVGTAWRGRRASGKPGAGAALRGPDLARALVAACFLLTLVAACEEPKRGSLPEGGPPPAPPPECDPDHPCPEGQVCALSRCYGTCAGDEDCSARERCAQTGALSGLCVARGEPLPSDVCEGKLCPADTPVCHPVSGQCVGCTQASHCTPELPVCDRGLGQCVARAEGVCAPCNDDQDCAATDDERDLRCVALEEPFERVCLVAGCASDTDCPPIFECLPGPRACVPRRGSCTAVRAAQEQRACEDHRACSAHGLPSESPYAGTCHGERCAFGCVTSQECPGELVCAPPVCVSDPASDAGPAAGADGGV